MTLSKKTKEELVSEVKKLQKKLDILKNQKSKTSNSQKKIESKDSMWESYFKNSDHTILVIDKNGCIIANSDLKTTASKEHVLGKPAISFIDKEHHSGYTKALKIVFKTGKSQKYQLSSSYGKDKTKVYYSSRLTPYFENKKIVAVIVDTYNNTNEILSKEALLQSEHKFKRLADSASEGIVIHAGGRIEEVNTRLCKMFGYSEKELIGKSILDFVHPDYKKVVIEKQQTKDESPYEALLFKKGKKTIWTKIKGSEILYNGRNARVAIFTDITLERETANKIKESEIRFRTLTENATDLIYRCSVYPELKYEYISPSVEAITGYTAEEFYAQPFLGFQIVHPNDVHLLGGSEKLIKQKSKLSNVLANEITVRWVKKNGEIIWTETRTKPIFNEQAKFIAIEGISRDITKQKLFEEELKDSEKRLKIISNATFEGIVFSENGKIIDANDQFVKMYGFNVSKEIIGKDLIDDFVIEEQKALAKRFLRLAKSEPFEVQTKTKTGEIITVETKGQNIPYFGKNIRATVIYNITERKHYEHSLRESERTLSTLMNNLPGMAYRCEYDSQWTMRFVSKGFKELTGYSPKDIINNKKRAFADIVHPADREIGVPQIKNAIKSKSPFEIEYRIITADGKEKWVWEKGEGVFSEKGNLLFIEGFITDVNDKKNNEIALNQSKENYKEVIDNSPDGILIYKDRKLEFANPSALKILEADSFEDIKNEPMCFFLLPEYHQFAEERMTQAQSEKDLPFMEIKMKTLKNVVKEAEAKPINIQYNGEAAIQIVMHDISAEKLLEKQELRAKLAEETTKKLQQEISERKNAERVLQETQKYTRLLIDSSLDMICASDKEGYITEFNAAAQTTFGYSLNDVLGKHVSMLYARPEERIRITNEELYGKGKFAGEVINLKSNGQQFVAYLSASVLKDDEGKVVGAMGVSRDISDLKKTEEKLYAQSAKLNAVFESSSHIIWTVDKEMKVTSFNKNFAHFFKTHYNVEMKNGLSTVSGNMVSTDDYNNFWIKKYQSAFKGESQHFETNLNRKSGESVWREIFINPIYDEAGNVIELSGIGHDTTEKKLAEEKIVKSLQEKEVLLKEVHHRVKNNLQVISSILNLQSSYVKDESTLNILRESQNRIKSMAFIHESLYQTKDFSSINFSEYVVNLSQNLIHSYSGVEHEIKLTLDIQNVFLNLDLAIPCGLIINEIVSNALKYAFVENNENDEISIKMALIGDELELIISDNGIGLPKSIDYRNTESLGLQLVVTLTDQLNGKIDLETKKGTKYTIKFKQNQVKNRI